MGTTSTNTIHDACRIVLRPLASMLLKLGMTWKEFSELAKTVFVETATAEHGIRGRPTNISRVSILTGIGRKEVKRQRELLATEAPPSGHKTTDATRVLSGWYQDPAYLDSAGSPQVLDETGPTPSFEALCASYSGDIAMPTMLKELLRNGSVERRADGRLIARRRYYQLAELDNDNLLWTVTMIRDLALTMNNNVFRNEKTVPRFGGNADNARIPKESAEAFRAFVDEHGQAFLEKIDNWLTEHAVSEPNDRDECIRLGVGLFAIDDRIVKEKNQ